MRKTPKYLASVQAKCDIVSGTTIIPAGTIGWVIYAEKGDTEVKVYWDFAGDTTCWADIKNIRKYNRGA